MATGVLGLIVSLFAGFGKLWKKALLSLVITIASLGIALVLVGGCGFLASQMANASIRAILDDSVRPLTELKVASDMYAVNIVDTAWKTRTGQITWGQGGRMSRPPALGLPRPGRPIWLQT